MQNMRRTMDQVAVNTLQAMHGNAQRHAQVVDTVHDEGERMQVVMGENCERLLAGLHDVGQRLIEMMSAVAEEQRVQRAMLVSMALAMHPNAPVGEA